MQALRCCEREKLLCCYLYVRYACELSDNEDEEAVVRRRRSVVERAELFVPRVIASAATTRRQRVGAPHVLRMGLILSLYYVHGTVRV